MSDLQKLIYLNRVIKQQWLKLSELEELQNRMLRNILHHAYANVPLYHYKFKEAGIYPDDIKTPKDLSKLPLTTKEELRNNFPHRTIADGVNLNKCWISHTGGSTGIPLKVAYGRRDEDYEKAIALRPNLSCGQRFWDRWAVITSSYHFIPKKWFQKLNLLSPNYINLYDSIDSQITQLKMIKPSILDGTASSIYLIAKRLKEFNNIKPRLIFTTADLLTEDMRDLIKSVFNCDIFDQFGCVELARTAWECKEHSGYHIDMDAVVMEFLRNGESVSYGERGEIVYTGLYNYTMPLIRYAIGDIGIPSDEICPCGRGLPLMKVVEGRRDDFITLPSGEICSPRVFSNLMKDISGIDQYKIIQEDLNKIKILISSSDEVHLSEYVIPLIRNEFTRFFGEAINIEIQLCNFIPKEASGKLRKVVSKVPLNFG